MSDKKKNILIIVLLLLVFILLVLFLLPKKEITVYTVYVENVGNAYTLRTDENGVLQEPEVPVIDGKKFLGWYIGDEKIEFPREFEEDSVITAKWEDEEKEPSYDAIVDPDVPQGDEQPEEDVPVFEETLNVSMGSKNITMNVGQKKTINVIINPKNYSYNKISWKSSNPSVVKVDNYGNIVALKSGTAKITVTIDGVKATCTVKVKGEVTYSVEYKKVDGSAIEQYRLFIKDSNGKYRNGVLSITTLAGETFEEKISANGSVNAYIKTAIKSIVIKNVS